MRNRTKACPRSSAWKAAIVRDLPIPASPERSTTRPSPRLASAHFRVNSSISSARPTSGISEEARSASNRLSIELGRSGCQTGTASLKPRSSDDPRLRSSKRAPTSRRVAAEISTVSGSAAACRRAARFGVSPTTSRSLVSPLPKRSPTTTSPVAMPTRICSLPEGRSSLPISSTRARPARTARSASSSSAWG